MVLNRTATQLAVHYCVGSEVNSNIYFYQESTAMRIFTVILWTAFLFGANAVSAQSASVFAESSYLNQTTLSLAAGESSFNKKTGRRSYRCPEHCS